MEKEDLLKTIEEAGEELISKLGAALGVGDKEAILQLVRSDSRAFGLAKKIVGALKPASSPASISEKIEF